MKVHTLKLGPKNTQVLLDAEAGLIDTDNVELNLSWNRVHNFRQGEGLVLETTEGTWIGEVAEDVEEGFGLLLVDLR